MKAGSGRVWTRERAGWEPGNRSFNSGSSNQSTSPALLLCSLISQQSQQHRRQRIISFTGHRGLNTHSSLLLSLVSSDSPDKHARCILTSQLSSSNHLSRTSDWVLVAPSNIEQRHPACDLQIIISVISTPISLPSILPHAGRPSTPKSLLSLSTPNAVLRTTPA